MTQVGPNHYVLNGGEEEIEFISPVSTHREEEGQKVDDTFEYSSHQVTILSNITPRKGTQQHSEQNTKD